MELLPDLQRLSVTEKDARIGDLWARIPALTETVAEQQGRLAKISCNFSKPQSSNGLNKPKPESLRQAGENPTGG